MSTDKSAEFSMPKELAMMVSYLIIKAAPLFSTATLCRYLTRGEKMGLQVRKTYENIKRSELVTAETSNNPHCL